MTRKQYAMLRRVDCKCDIILAQLASLNKRATQQDPIGRAIEELHRNALFIRTLSEMERDQSVYPPQ